MTERHCLTIDQLLELTRTAALTCHAPSSEQVEEFLRLRGVRTTGQLVMANYDYGHADGWSDCKAELEALGETH